MCPRYTTMQRRVSRHSDNGTIHERIRPAGTVRAVIRACHDSGSCSEHVYHNSSHRAERRDGRCRVDTQFTGINSTIQYNLANWQNGVLAQTNAQLGRFSAAANPRQMSMSIRIEF